jgi:DNA polymerase III alpha subunit
MYLDNFSRSIFTKEDLFNVLYEHGPNIIQKLVVEDSEEINELNQFLDNPAVIKTNLPNYNSVNDYDSENQKEWFIPENYKSFDIEEFLVNQCPKENYERLIAELQEFRSKNMIDLLRWLKYFVDTCRTNNIVWGVGRGSSVSSYVLFLIGVHKIDSVKYNLDYKEFLR